MSPLMIGKAGRVSVPANEVDAYRRRGYVPADEYVPPADPEAEEKPKAKSKKAGKKKDQGTAETVADSDE